MFVQFQIIVTYLKLFLIVCRLCFFVNLAPLYDADSFNNGPFGNLSLEGSKADDSRVVPPKYMLDLYHLLVDQHGLRRKGVILNGDKVRCFFPGTLDSLKRDTVTFSIDDIAENERIVRAELHLFKFRNLKSSGAVPAFIRVGIADASKRTVEMVRVFTSRSNGWKSFLLTKTVERWHHNKKEHNGLHINIQSKFQQMPFRISSRNAHRPFLVVFTMNKQKSESTIEDKISHAIPRSIVPDNNRGSRKKREPAQLCRRKSMIVNTKDIGWDRYILAPRTFDAYRCEGKCTAYSSKAAKKQTNHAVLQAVLSQLHDKSDGQHIPIPCCAPAKFQSKTLLLHRKVNGESIIGLEDFSDMIVESCACL